MPRLSACFTHSRYKHPPLCISDQGICKRVVVSSRPGVGMGRGSFSNMLVVPLQDKRPGVEMRRNTWAYRTSALRSDLAL